MALSWRVRLLLLLFLLRSAVSCVEQSPVCQELVVIRLATETFGSRALFVSANNLSYRISFGSVSSRAVGYVATRLRGGE